MTGIWKDIFEIQDELIQAIVSILPGRVEAAAQERAERKPTESMAAYECVLAGKRLHHRSTPDDNIRAQEMMDRAIELDPQYAHALVWRACAIGQSIALGAAEDPAAAAKAIVAEIAAAAATTN